MSSILIAVLVGLSWTASARAEEKGEKPIRGLFFGEAPAKQPAGETTERDQFQQEWARQEAAKRAAAAAQAQGGAAKSPPPARVEADFDPKPPTAAPVSDPVAEAKPIAGAKPAAPKPSEQLASGREPSSRATSRGLASVRRTTAAFTPDEKLRDSPRATPAAGSAAGTPRPPIPAEAVSSKAGPIGSPAAKPAHNPVSPDTLGRVFDAAPANAEAGPAGPRPAPATSVDCAGRTQPLARDTVCGPAAAPGGPSLVVENAAPAPSAAPVFVTMDLDLTRTPGQYRDAVAGLTRNAGFTMDARFAPMYRGPDRDKVSVWGWLPAEKVRQAIALEGVQRLEAAPQAAPSPARPAPESDWRIALRLPAAEAAEPAMAAALLRLNEVGLNWKRTESRDAAGVVTIVGTMPSRSLSRVMADPAVLRMEPLRSAPPAAPPAAPLEASAGPVAELGKLLRGHPILLLLAALFPLIGSILRSSR